MVPVPGEVLLRTFMSLLVAFGALISADAFAHDIYGCLVGEKVTYVNTAKELEQRQRRGEECRLIQRVRGPEPVVDTDDIPRAVRPSTKRKRSVKAVPVADRGSLKERAARYAGYVDEAATKYILPAAFIRAVIRTESAFRFDAVSSKGAQGLMQLMPRTARSMGVSDSFDPRQNIMGGARLLRVLANKYDGDMVKVLSAYHAGPGNLAKKGGIPFSATEGYVRAVLDHYYRYKASGG